MGINYYAVRSRPTTEEPIHIGKSSAGWLFSFHQVNDEWHEPQIVWNTYNQVKEWLYEYTVKNSLYVILNEYDEEISCEDFFAMVDAKQKDPACKGNLKNFDYAKNIDGYRFIEGEFC